MLQQTQVATVVPYYLHWLERFPTLDLFARAPLDDVLKLWEGLGYYSRARNFHKAAQVVMAEHVGVIPQTVDALMRLPGIGRYTAGAIASLAFNQDAPLLDGNVKRVLSRVHGLRTASDDELWQLAESALPKGRAGVFNEALMELGATVCTPRTPRCVSCPINKHCQAFASGDPEAFPAKRVRAATPHHDVLTAIVMNENGEVLMGQRPRDGLLGGLWEFVSSEFRGAGGELVDVVRERTGLLIDESDAVMIGAVKHAFTHFKITRHVYLVHIPTNQKLKPSFPRRRESRPASTLDSRLRGNDDPNGYDQLRWVPFDQVRALALTRSDQKILELYEKHCLSFFAQTR